MRRRIELIDAVVAADVRIRDDACLEIIGIFPREIERRWKRVGNVARGTDTMPDDDFVRLAGPLLSLAFGKPIAGVLEDGFTEIGTGGDGAEDARKCVAGG